MDLDLNKVCWEEFVRLDLSLEVILIGFAKRTQQSLMSFSSLTYPLGFWPMPLVED